MKAGKTLPTLTIPVVLRPGRCRWCQCTYETPCANGCSWADRAQTLCSECVPLDTAMRSVTGRRELAAFVQEYGFLAGTTMTPMARPSAGRRTSR